jgi:hypothetical protein
MTNGTHPAARAACSALIAAASGTICLTTPARNSASISASVPPSSSNRSPIVAASCSRDSSPSLSAVTSHCASASLPPRAATNSRAQRPNAPALSMSVLSRSISSSGTRTR